MNQGNEQCFLKYPKGHRPTVIPNLLFMLDSILILADTNMGRGLQPFLETQSQHY